MIYGIGHDIVAIARIEQALTRHGEGFAARVLGPGEMAVYRQRLVHSRLRAVQFVATRFAAKEAVSKALGLGMRSPMGFHAGEVTNNELGQPVWNAGPGLAQWLAERHLHTHLTLSDDAAYASAVAVVERRVVS
jgi:holo-[acyl-carrier protein] synthase